MKRNNIRITRIDSDWDVRSYFSSKQSEQAYGSRKEKYFWRLYDDVSHILRTLLRYTICIPFSLQFPDKKAKLKMARKKHEFGEKENVDNFCCAHNWLSYYKTSTIELYKDETAQNDNFPSHSSVFNNNLCTKRFGKEGTKHKNQPRSIMQKLFSRIRQGSKCAKSMSGISVQIHNTYSSTDNLPAGDGPQVKKEQLKRVTAFFNDIYMEQQKFLDREKSVRVKKNRTPKLDRKLALD